MRSHQFEPFGENLPNDRDYVNKGASGLLVLIVGSFLWPLIGAIIVARAVFFDPQVFVEFDAPTATSGAADSVKGLH